MTKINLTIRGLLEYIKYAIQHRRYEAALGLIEDALRETLQGDEELKELEKK